MNPDELTPLAKRDDDPFERALLRAAKRERAPDGADRRLLTALGTGGAAGGSAFAAFVTRHASRIGAKGVLVSVAIAVTVAGAAHWARSRPPSPPQPQRVSVAPTAEAPRPAPEEGRLETVPSTRVEDLPETTTKKAVRAPAAATPASAGRTEATAGPNLAREVALVEDARAALAHGDVTKALRSLDVHDREFPDGTLSPESRVLRIEALVRAGGERNIARANALAAAFLASHPTGPHARRVRAVLDRNR